jgi:hypothetical protein
VPSHRSPGRPDQDILDLAGPPYPVTGCTITGDLNALNANHQAIAARDQLAALDGITTGQPAAYPAPLATLLRTWSHQHRDEDITTSLSALRNAILRDCGNEEQ